MGRTGCVTAAVEIKTSHCRWWLLLSVLPVPALTPPHCLFVFSPLIYLHKAQSFSFFLSRLVPCPLFFLHVIRFIFSPFSHCEPSGNSSSLSNFVKTNWGKHSAQTKWIHSVNSNTSLISFRTLAVLTAKCVLFVTGTFPHLVPVFCSFCLFVF